MRRTRKVLRKQSISQHAALAVPTRRTKNHEQNFKAKKEFNKTSQGTARGLFFLSPTWPSTTRLFKHGWTTTQRRGATTRTPNTQQRRSRTFLLQKASPNRACVIRRSFTTMELIRKLVSTKGQVFYVQRSMCKVIVPGGLFGSGVLSDARVEVGPNSLAD